MSGATIPHDGEAADAEARRRERWRILLGDGSEALGGMCAQAAAQERALGYLYDRGLGAGRNTRRAGAGGAGSRRSGGLEESVLSIPDWINDVHELFPAAVVDRIEDDALERYGLTELVTRTEVLERVDPSPALLKAILATKHLMNAEVLAAARALVAQMVRQLLETLAQPVRSPFTGRRDPLRRSHNRIAANFDAQATIRANLKNLDRHSGRLVIAEPLFSSRVRRHTERWQLITLVDQSGSMVESVIHAAVCASIFHGVGAMRSHLVAFDTSVVDLTSEVTDPVETLMTVQLGGGTDIGQALRYADGLIDAPRRAIVVLITDLIEGGDPSVLLRCAERIVESGARLLVLGALNHDGSADYDRQMAARLTRIGVEVGVMTPHELAEWVAEVIG